MPAYVFMHQFLTGKTPWFYAYILLVPLVNWSFSVVPNIPLPDGGAWPPVAILTGFILVVRDFAQKEAGHYIFGGLLIGVLISFFMAPAAIAIASAAAFLISEVVDWLIYTFVKRPLSERVMISSIVAAPLDTGLFWYLASLSIKGVFQPLTLVTAGLSKLVGAYIVYLMLKRKESQQAQAATS